MIDQEWFDTSVVGSEYEEQRSLATGGCRHRKRILIPGEPESQVENPWLQGPAPQSET